MAKFRPNLLVTEMRPMEALVKRAQAGTRFSLLLIGVFAVIAALLAGVGLYGVLSNAGATAHGGDRRPDGSRRDAREASSNL